MPITYFSIVGPNDASIFEYGRFGAGEASTLQHVSFSSTGTGSSTSVASPQGTSLSTNTSSAQATTAPAGAPSVAAVSSTQDAGLSSASSTSSQQLARQFMLYSALDLADEVVWSKGDFYLSKVDKFDDRFYVSVYIAFAPVKLMLMQDQEPHDNVRPFFSDAYELCVRYLLSPFVNANQPIRSREFEERMISIFTRYF